MLKTVVNVMFKKSTRASSIFCLIVLILGSVTTSSLHDILNPMNVSTSTETISFDETGTHESRQSLVGTSPVTLFQTGGDYFGDWAACWGIETSYSEWDCTDKNPAWSSSHTLEYDKYTFEAEVVYSYNIRHHGSVDLEITSSRQGNYAPTITTEIQSSSDAYEVEVKASVEFTIKRIYVGENGLSSDLRNSFTHSIPFPSLVDVDGDGSYKMLGNVKVYTWDSYADLNSLSTSETGLIGSKEDLSEAINLASIDLLELASKYTSSSVLKAVNYFVYVNFDIDLDIDFYLQSAVLPFLGTSGATHLAQSFNSDSARMAYPCKLALRDELSSSAPTLTTSCTRVLPQDAESAHLQLGLWHDYDSTESYSAHLRVGAQSNYVAQKIWNLFTNQNYFQYTITSGQFLTSQRSQDTDLTPAVIEIDIPAPQSVIENNAPVSALAVSPTATVTGTSVYAVTSGSYDQDGDAFTVQVSWGDGSNTTQSYSSQTKSHTYESPGTYTISLETIDVNGASGFTTQTVVISQAASTLTSYLVANQTSIVEGDSVTFSWGASGGSGSLSHSLTYGDNDSYSGNNFIASHIFENAGQFGANLVTSDGTNTITKSVQIIVEPDYSSDGITEANFDIVGDQILVVVDDNNAELYPVSGSYDEFDATHLAPTSRDALFESLSVMSEIRGVDWDLYFVGNSTGNEWDYNNESGPGLNFLKDYSTVIWTTGNHYYPLTDTDFENLEIYSNAGGTIIMFSQDILWGDCSFCTTYNSTNALNETFGLSESEQDVGLGTTLYNSDGSGNINVAYLPLAGLQEITTRGVSGSENVSYVNDYADSITTWNSNMYALGSDDNPIMNSTEGNHGILNMNGTKTAFFAFDPVQFQHRYDLEMLMLGLSEWGDSSFVETYKMENATHLPSGVDGAVLMGPWSDESQSNRTNELSKVFSMYTIEGHTYQFNIGNGPISGDTSVEYWNGTAWEWVMFTDSWSYCFDGPIATTSLTSSTGSSLNSVSSCDYLTGEWTVTWTAPATEKVYMNVVAEDLLTGDFWSLYTGVSFSEQSDTTSSKTLLLDIATVDILHSDANTSNSVDYSGSVYDLSVQAGTTYAVSIERSQDLNTQFYLGIHWYSSDDATTYNFYGAEYLWDSATHGALVFTALNTTTIYLEGWIHNYSNPHITDGKVSLLAWEIDSQQPIDDYWNASDLNSSPSGYVDYEYDWMDWWTMPVVEGETYSLDVHFDTQDFFTTAVYFHPYNDPINFTLMIESSSYGDNNLLLENIGFGELKIAIVADRDGANLAGSRGNYTLEVDQVTISAPINDILFGVVGYDSSMDLIEIDMVEDSNYVIRLNSTPSWLVGDKQGDYLDVYIETPSGQMVYSSAYGDANNRTLIYSATETGTHSIFVEGQDGSYWIWPFEDIGPVFISLPQRFATAEVQFNDTVFCEQYISSNGDSYVLETWQTFHLDQAPFGFTLDNLTGEISYLPSRADVGNHSISIRLENEWGMMSWQNYTLMVAQLPNSAPIITSLGGSQATVSYQFSTIVLASDIDNDTLSYSLLSAPLGSSIDSQTGQLTWTPSTVGIQQFSVVVSDALGLSSTITFNVSATNIEPVFSAVANATTSVGSPYTNTVSATDPDGHVLVYGLRNGPSGLTMSSQGAISWNPSSNQVGEHLVVLEVNDPYGGSDVLVFSVTVPNTPAVMTLTGVPSTLFPGETLALNSVLTDSDGHQVWMILEEGPQGATVTSNGSILWVPQGDQIGIHEFKIIVIDAWGEGERETLSIEVVNRDPSGEFSTPLLDTRLRMVYTVYSMNDPDVQQLSTMCSGNDLTQLLLSNGEILLTWNVPVGELLNTISCTTTDSYGGSTIKTQALEFSELNLTSLLIGNTLLSLGESAQATWSLPFSAEAIQTTIIMGNGALSIEGSGNEWSLEYTPSFDQERVIISLEAVSEHSDVVSALWIFDYEHDAFELEVDSSQTFDYGVLATSVLNTPTELSLANATVLVGDGEVMIENQMGVWSLSYTPNGDVGVQIVFIETVDEYGRTAQTYWHIRYAAEDLSWSCQVGEFQDSHFTESELMFDCSREDIVVEVIDVYDPIISVNVSVDLVNVSNLPFGQTTFFIQLSGPDGSIETLYRDIFVIKPLSSGTFDLDSVHFVQTQSKVYELRIEEGMQFESLLNHSEFNTDSAYCSFEEMEESMFDGMATIQIGNDCSIFVIAGDNANQPTVVRAFLHNESGNVLDTITLELVFLPQETASEPLLSNISIVSTSLGMLFGTMLTFFATMMFKRKDSSIDLQNSSDSNKQIPQMREVEDEVTQLQHTDASGEVRNTEDDFKPAIDANPTSTDDSGYEWYKHANGNDYYRITGSQSEWTKFES